MKKVLKPGIGVVVLGILLFAVLMAVRGEFDNSLIRTAMAAAAGCALALVFFRQRRK